ncbi:uncharacterized protein LOC117651232 [Thrips palmi]|uniref:Uncharacterized protein LOC117651232 n=1 Tax=Thrips palmi TaxID=161013 RepID=A0A6P9A0I3_THRPL|nr:uncharacterized protein LOC117651232 [Thrips palmi]
MSYGMLHMATEAAFLSLPLGHQGRCHRISDLLPTLALPSLWRVEWNRIEWKECKQCHFGGEKGANRCVAMSEAYNNPKPGVLFHQSAKAGPLGAESRQGKGLRSKFPKGEPRKTLVRNTELTVYPTIYKSDVPVQEPKKKESPKGASCCGLYKTNLSAPCLNSALRLVKEMKQAAKAKPSSTQCAKLVDEGKVLQQVNFLYEEHLYHDLVALNVSDTDLIESSSSRPASKYRARVKDKEPHLSQFFTPTFSEEYHIPRDPPCRTRGEQHTSNSFTMYQRMKTWDEFQ